MQVPCPKCGRRLNVPESALGKKGRCPDCQHVFRLSPVEDPSQASTYGFAEQSRCPNCGEGIEPDSVLCTQCGTKLRTGQVQAGDSPWGQPSPTGGPAATSDSQSVFRQTPPKQQDKAGSPSLVKAAVGATVGAGVGAAVWAGVSYLTGYEIGWLAVLIGLLSGGGARTMSGGPSASTGAVAAVVAALGVVLGSYAGYHFSIRSDTNKEEFRKGFEAFASDVVDRYDETSAREKEEVFEEAYQEALKETTYSDVMLSTTKDTMLFLLFVGVGLFFAFKVGAGTGSGGG